MNESEYLKDRIRELAATYRERSKDEIYVPAYRAASMEITQELSKASKIVNLDHSTESRTISSLEELDALIHELGDRVIIDIPDSEEVSLTVYDDYLE